MNMCVSVWGREREIQVWVINGRVCIGLSAVSINTFWLSCTYQSNVLYCFRVLEDNYYHLCNIHWLHKDINNNYWMYKQLDRSLVVESGQIKQLKTFVANRLIFKLKKKKKSVCYQDDAKNVIIWWYFFFYETESIQTTVDAVCPGDTWPYRHAEWWPNHKLRNSRACMLAWKLEF